MKKKILFVIPALRGGGAERALVLLLRHIDRERFCPKVVVFDSQNDYKEDLPVDIEIISFGKQGISGMFGNLLLIWALSRLIKVEKPDLLYSSMHYTNNLTGLAKRFSWVKVPLFFIYQNNTTMEYKPRRLRSVRLVKWIQRNIIYPAADRFICVSKGVMDDLIENWDIPREKACVIYNPVEIDRMQVLAKEDVEHIWFKEGRPVIIACGRLTAQKNYALLFKAFAIVSKERPDLRLIILGEGELKNELTAYAVELGISDKTDFIGFHKNPFKFIARAKVFALSSLWEGFGNVLIEAMACGTSVISTRCPSGPDEIITDEVNGLLVPVEDEKAFAAAIIRLLDDEPFREQLAEAGKMRVEEFRAEKIAAEYGQTFDKVLRN
ncbi:MAG: glycosyltransferase [Deltaproteobacteria bacterium]|nr:glycosyltransferase [Deltaproteobacteria bacterium]